VKTKSKPLGYRKGGAPEGGSCALQNLRERRRGGGKDVSLREKLESRKELRKEAGFRGNLKPGSRACKWLEGISEETSHKRKILLELVGWTGNTFINNAFWGQ